MPTTNNWDADPKKYARLSEPFENKEQVQVSARAFLGELAALREKYRIPELIVQFQCYVKDEDNEGERLFYNGGAGWGNQLYQAQLAKRALDLEFDHLGRLVQFVADSIPRVRRELITDPTERESFKGKE